MKNNLKKFFNVFSSYFLWFIIGVALAKAIDFANFLMTYPNDITFFVGLFIHILAVGVLGYGIYSIIINIIKNKKENEN